MATSTAANTSFVDPGRYYTRDGLIRDSGLSASRLRELRLLGLELPTLRVGRRIFIRGRDAIDFIEKAAAMDCAS